jgi:predicted NUDIX family NTP pyrophosphohydrolase
MAQRSAGILMYRWQRGRPELFLVHPGGPFWAKKDEGAWSIPKGLTDTDEDHEAAARREFFEETGATAMGELMPLGQFKQPGGKIVIAFALEGDFDPATLSSNSFEMEWPPRSGRKASFPEVDRAGWFGPDEARRKILKGQAPIIETLLTSVGSVHRPG